MSKKAPANASAPIEGFLDRVDVVTEAMASASAATVQEAPVEALVPLSEPISAKESTQAEMVVTEEFSPIPAKITTPQKGVIPAGAS